MDKKESWIESRYFKDEKQLFWRIITVNIALIVAILISAYRITHPIIMQFEALNNLVDFIFPTILILSSALALFMDAFFLANSIYLYKVKKS